MASALTIGALLISFYNLLIPINRIRMSFIGWWKIWCSLGLFFLLTCVANILPYINKPTLWYLGYPLFWNVFAFFAFFSFLRLCYKMIFGPLCYKKKKKSVFFDYINQCSQENIPAKSFSKEVIHSLDNILSDYEKSEDGSYKWNEYAEKVMLLLSSKNIVQEFVENNSILVEKIVKNYANFDEKHINSYLLQRIIVESALDENSLYNKRLLGNYNYEIEKLLSKNIVDKYDILSFFDSEHERLNSELTLNVYEDIAICTMVKADKLSRGVHSCLRLLNKKLAEIASIDGLGIRCVFERALFEIINNDKKIVDGYVYDYKYNHSKPLRDGIKEQFVVFFNSFEQKNNNDESLYSALIGTWENFQENKENAFVKELLDEIVKQAKNNPDLNGLNRIIRVMENKGTVPQSSLTETPLQSSSKKKVNPLMARIEKFIKEHLL